MHVDDIIIAALTNKRLAQVKRDLASRFDIKDLGKLHHFLKMAARSGLEMRLAIV